MVLDAALLAFANSYLTLALIFLYTPFGARAKSSRWEQSRLHVYVVLARGGVDEHRHVVVDALPRSE